jgi:hypothetical protein
VAGRFEKAIEREDGENYDRAGEEFDRHAETKKSFRIPDIIGRSRGVPSHDECVRDIEKGEGGREATDEIQERRDPGLFLERVEIVHAGYSIVITVLPRA